MSIQSIRRAFDIMQVVARTHDGARLSDIARATGLPKSTVARILSTLSDVGAVTRQGRRDGYRIGRAVESLVGNASWLETAATPWLARLAEQTSETVTLATLDGDQLHYIAQLSDQNSHLQLRDWTDRRVSTLHIAAGGKIFLAYDDPLRQRYLENPLQALTENTITDAGQLTFHLRAVQRNGCAWDREENERGLSGVSAPIFAKGQQVVAAISVYGPSFRLASDGGEAELSRLVVEAAAEISRRMMFPLSDAADKQKDDAGES